MAQINLNDPSFGIKIIPAEEALSKIPMEILITKIVDLYRRTHGKEPLLKLEGGWASALNEERMKTEAGAKAIALNGMKMTMEEIKKEFEEIPIGNSTGTVMFGRSL